MKTEKEIRDKLAEISAKIAHIYKHGNVSEKACSDIRDVLQIREDILEWVLES